MDDTISEKNLEFRQDEASSSQGDMSWLKYVMMKQTSWSNLKEASKGFSSESSQAFGQFSSSLFANVSHFVNSSRGECIFHCTCGVSWKGILVLFINVSAMNVSLIGYCLYFAAACKFTMYYNVL